MKAFLIFCLMFLTLCCNVQLDPSPQKIPSEDFSCHTMKDALHRDGFNEFHWATINADYLRDEVTFANRTNSTLSVHTESFHIDLLLWEPSSVFHPNCEVIIFDGQEEHVQNVTFLPKCHVFGKTLNGYGMASLSFCDGLRGIITTNGTDYQVLPSEPNCRPGQYLLATRQSGVLWENVLKQVQSIEQPKERLSIEMALVYDEYMYKYMEEVMQAKTFLQKLQYIITTWNTVQYEFLKENELNYSVKFLLVNIFFWKTNQIGSVSTLRQRLAKACTWANQRSLSADHIHIVSGVRGSFALGLSMSAAACTPAKCSLSRSWEWLSRNTLSHELAHNLGIPHDAMTHCGNMTQESSGLMGSRKTGWSQCSSRHLRRWLKSGKGKCLKTVNVFIPENKNVNSTKDVLNTNGYGLLPAMYESSDVLCQQRFGERFQYIPLYPAHVCGIQSCAILLPGSDYGVLKVNNHGLDGLYCGQGKVCRFDMRCENLTETNLWVPILVVSGGWSEWSPYTDCSRSCGAGVRISTRRCDNPRPVNTEWCKGQSIRGQLCNVQPCFNDSSNYFELVKQRASEVCTMLLQYGYLDSKNFSSNGRTLASPNGTLKYFKMYPNRSVKGFDDLGRINNVSLEGCANGCLSTKECNSFEYKPTNRKCDLSSISTKAHDLNPNSLWDFYERDGKALKYFKMYPNRSVRGFDDLGRKNNVSLEQCASACLVTKKCYSFEYKPTNRKCDLSSISTKTHDLNSNDFWDFYERHDKDFPQNGVCEVSCVPLHESDILTSVHVAFLPDGSPCNTDVNTQWRCIRGTCRKFENQTFSG
ncbi:A disintegrin and metalloproteinase with thrombospondin motifs 1 [Octopus bimaculoides]|uniref:Peptidase M12B domain-containing protein n=1 Tax=Octopus bimaculoides TaxID=37653 RepID=A0A0L8H6T5_OCTBM|nr:A disintegrin and metalloproteinase with thrombospondin motifs 1 [Octopus bimaculoides]|eukprot:XP_014774988.1 PREDICTED: A disintegrin and metalloproteinase with thrombospondin motifs 1-like [Octopus bimaculoides]